MTETTNPDAPHFISEGDMSTSRLCAVLETSGMRCETQHDDDGDVLYVRQGLQFPLWIRVDAQFRFLQIHSYVNIDARIDGQFEAVNALNEEAPLLQFHIDGTRLYGYFWICMASGVNVRQLVLVLRQFAGTFTAGAHALVSKTEAKGESFH